MKEQVLLMTEHESKTEDLIKRSMNKKITQKLASLELGITERHFRRKVAAYKKFGISGIISKRRGKASNRKLPTEFTDKVINLIKKHYYDFGPTLATEKLFERDGIKISVETVRQLMIKSGLWYSKERRKRKVHPLRERRQRMGELVQADASPHAWFENRRGKCALIVFVDDATSRLMLRFYESETTQAYAETYQKYIHKYGVPIALYTDRHSIFIVNNNKKNLKKKTQFTRMIETTGTKLITANSPQAKGRVERNNLTLQDRLVKELRLQKIDTIEEANKFLEDGYTDFLNRKFMVKPVDPEDMHQKIKHSLKDEEKIFSIQATRQVSNSLNLSYDNTTYQIITSKYPYTIKKENVLICKSFKTEEVKIYFRNQEMKYKIIEKGEKMHTENSKTVNATVDVFVKEKEKANS